MQKLFRFVLPAALGIAALGTATVLASREATASAAQNEKAAVTKKDVCDRIEQFLLGLGDTTKRGELITKMLAGGPMEGLAAPAQQISAYTDLLMREGGVPTGGVNGVALAEEKSVGDFLLFRSYMLRGEKGPMAWQFLMYQYPKGWGILAVNPTPAISVFPQWKEFKIVNPQQQPKGQPANAAGER